MLAPRLYCVSMPLLLHRCLCSLLLLGIFENEQVTRRRLMHSWLLNGGGGGRRAGLSDRSGCGWRQRTHASLTPHRSHHNLFFFFLLLKWMQHTSMLPCLQAKMDGGVGGEGMKLHIGKGIWSHPPAPAWHGAETWFLFTLALLYGCIFPRVFFVEQIPFHVYTLNHMTYCK